MRQGAGHRTAQCDHVCLLYEATPSCRVGSALLRAGRRMLVPADVVKELDGREAVYHTAH